jgi:O-antigen/teichoic acid export membrane protein
MANDLKKKTVSGFAYKMLERIGAQGVNFIVSIILARLLLPEEYGVISLVLVLITLLDVFVTYGFGNSLIANKESDDVDFSTCFYFGICLSLIVYAIVYFCSPLVASFYKIELLTPVLRVMGLRVPIAAINSVQHAYVSKHMMFRKFFISTSIGTILSGIIAIIMAYHGFGVWALVEQYMGNVVCDTICLWIIVGWRPICAFSFTRLKKIYDYGWKILVVGLVDTGYNQLRSLVIVKKYTSSDLAFYNKGNQFPSLGMSVIEPTVNGVLFPALSQCNDNQNEMRGITRRMIMMSTYIVFPMMIGLMAIAKPLVIVLLTEKWLPCVIYLQIGCLSYMFRPLQFINNSVIKASGRSGLLLKLDILKKGIGIVLLLISMNYGVIGIAISLVVTNIISVFINITPNRAILNYGYGAQFLDIAKSGVLAVIMGFIVFALSFLPIRPIILLAIQIIVGVSFYLITSHITQNESYIYALNMLKNMRRKKKTV